MSSNMSNISLSESLSGYLTAEDEADDTQYLSVLNPDVSFGNVDETLVHSFERENEKNYQKNSETDEPLIFTVDGSNEIYGVQVAQDENGQLQKYQIQYLQNENGELVPMIETIQLLPSEEFNNINSIDDTPTNNVLELTEHQDMEYQTNQLNCDEENVSVMEPNEETENHKYTYNPTESEKEEALGYLDNIQNNVKLEDNNEMRIFKSEYESIASEITRNDEENLKESTDENNEYVIERIDTESNENSPSSTVTNERVKIEKIFIQEVIGDNNVEESIVENPDNEIYQIVEGMHVTGDDEDQQCQTVLKETAEHYTKTNILKKSPYKNVKTFTLDDKVIYVETITEKENIEFGRIQKTSSRSLLKCNQPNQPLLPKSTSVLSSRVETTEDKTSKRFCRTKEAKQARQFMNFINSTTIIQAPERKERLPRKQQIKPVEHPDEDIVVKEMIVASNGFVEPISEEEKKYLPVTEYVELIDSEDDTDNTNSKKNKNRKQSKTVEIEISDSEESDESDNNEDKVIAGAVKKKRSRSSRNREDGSKDSDTNSESPPKISRLEHEVECVTSNLQSISVENETNQVANNEAKQHTNIPDILVSEPQVQVNSNPGKGVDVRKRTLIPSSINRVRKSIQFTKPQGVKRKEFDYKYECEKCKMKFINRILLGKHECPKKKSTTCVKKNVKLATGQGKTKQCNIPIPSSPAIHEKPPSIECDQCDIKFNCKAEWFDHHVQNHDDEFANEIGNSITKLSSASAHKGVPLNNDQISRSFQMLRNKIQQLK